MWIMIAGPYRSGTHDPEEWAGNLGEMNRTAHAVFGRGHTPVIGANMALPVIEAAGGSEYDAIMMPLSIALAQRCDGILRIGGTSAGADLEVERVRRNGGVVFDSLEAIPDLHAARASMLAPPEPVSEVAIRPGVEADAAQLAALAIGVWLHSYATEGVSRTVADYILQRFTPQAFRQIARDSGQSLVVAQIAEHVVGYALVRFDTPAPSGPVRTEVATLYVHEHIARQGIGTRLLRAAEDEALKRTGSRRIWLGVYHGNAKAIAFYRKLGYVQDGVTYFELGGEKYENFVMVGPKSGE